MKEDFGQALSSSLSDLTTGGAGIEAPKSRLLRKTDGFGRKARVFSRFPLLQAQSGHAF
jgi:hypothetical protein